MNTPSAPFEKARSRYDRSTLPVHMTRISLTSVAYCSLETPARSAAPYPHHWHTKPTILGLKVSAELIRLNLLYRHSGESRNPVLDPGLHRGDDFLRSRHFYASPTAASIWLKSSSSVKCLREIAAVGHTALQRPSPLQSTGLTLAFLPCGVS